MALAFALLLAALPLARPASGAASCRGRSATIEGTDGPDVLQGTNGADVISAGAGADTVNAGEGADIVCGDAGDDFLDPGHGDDIINGGAGNDWASYAEGQEPIRGRLGRYGSPGGVAAVGDFDDDLFGIENLEGTAFDDVIGGGDRDNTLSMGEGDDKFIWDFTDVGEDIWDGGPGLDTALYYRSPGPVKVDLTNKIEIPSAPSAGDDTLISVEAVGGSAFPDEFKGNDDANRFYGSSGPDTGRGTYTYVADSHESNTMQGSGGDDKLFASIGDHILRGGSGNDELEGVEGNDQLFGEDGDDVLAGGGGNDHLDGGAGEDTLSGGYGADTCAGDIPDRYAHCAGGGEDDELIDRPTGPLAVSDLRLQIAEPRKPGKDGQFTYKLTVTNLGPDDMPAGENVLGTGLNFFSGGQALAATGSNGFECYYNVGLDVYSYARCWNTEPIADGDSVTAKFEFCPFERVQKGTRYVCSPKEPDIDALEFSAVMLNGFGGHHNLHLDPVWENNVSSHACPDTVGAPRQAGGGGAVCAPWIVISPSSLDGEQGGPEDVAALDFANQPNGNESDPQVLTIANRGTADLSIENIEVVTGPFIPKNAADCTGSPIPPGGQCQLEVTFKPAFLTDTVVNGKLRITDNALNSPHLVSLLGTGTMTLLPPATVSESQGKSMSRDCEPGRILGWKRLSKKPETLVGEVLQAHLAAEDASINVFTQALHNNSDFNFFVYPDPSSRSLLASPGNWHTADDYEVGRIEVEWERWSSMWRGLPEWAWPTQGDRVRVVGNHIFDCGHKDRGHRSEIHPARLVVTYRNSALSRLSITPPLSSISGRLGSFEPHSQTPATEVDVFASSYGGPAIRSEDARVPGRPSWFQQVDDRDYKFKIMAPPKPSPDAVLEHRVEQRAFLGVTDDARRPDLGLKFDKLPGGRGYEVTLPRSVFDDEAKEDVMVYGVTAWVFWSGKRVEELPLRTYTVTLKSLHIREALSGDWSFYGYVNDKARGSLLFEHNCGPSQNERCIQDTTEDFMLVRDGELICFHLEGDEARGCTKNLQLVKFTVTLLPGQPLRVAFRGSDWGPFGSADFLGTAWGSWADPPPPQVELVATNMISVGKENDVDCSTPCYSVIIEIERTKTP